MKEIVVSQFGTYTRVTGKDELIVSVSAETLWVHEATGFAVGALALAVPLSQVQSVQNAEANVEVWPPAHGAPLRAANEPTIPEWVR